MSGEVIDYLSNLFTSLAFFEGKSEQGRQYLSSYRQFNPKSIFNLISTSQNAIGVSRKQFGKFLDSQNQFISKSSLKLLFQSLGRVSKDHITWMEFMNFLVSKECSFFDSLSANSKFQSQEIDLKVLEAFFQVLENEIYGLKELEKLKRRLYRHRYCDFRKIFDLMDVDKKGYLDLRDIYDFMKSEDPRISYAESERTLRRLDHNGDKKIDFQEFFITMKPSSLYMDYHDKQLRSITSQDFTESQDSNKTFCQRPNLYPNSGTRDDQHAPAPKSGSTHQNFRRSFASNDYGYDNQFNKVRFQPQSKDQSSSSKSGSRRFISDSDYKPKERDCNKKEEQNKKILFKIESNKKQKLKTSISPLTKSQLGATDSYTPSKIRHKPEFVPEHVQQQVNEYQPTKYPSSEKRRKRRRKTSREKSKNSTRSYSRRSSRSFEGSIIPIVIRGDHQPESYPEIRDSQHSSVVSPKMKSKERSDIRDNLIHQTAEGNRAHNNQPPNPCKFSDRQISHKYSENSRFMSNRSKDKLDDLDSAIENSLKTQRKFVSPKPQEFQGKFDSDSHTIPIFREHENNFGANYNSVRNPENKYTSNQRLLRQAERTTSHRVIDSSQNANAHQQTQGLVQRDEKSEFKVGTNVTQNTYLYDLNTDKREPSNLKNGYLSEVSPGYSNDLKYSQYTNTGEGKLVTRFSSKNDLALGNIQSRNYATVPSNNPTNNNNHPILVDVNLADKRNNARVPEKAESGTNSVSPAKSILKNGANSSRYKAPIEDQNQKVNFQEDPKPVDQSLTNRSQNYIGRTGYKGVYKHTISPREFQENPVKQQQHNPTRVANQVQFKDGRCSFSSREQQQTRKSCDIKEMPIQRLSFADQRFSEQNKENLGWRTQVQIPKVQVQQEKMDTNQQGKRVFSPNRVDHGDFHISRSKEWDVLGKSQSVKLIEPGIRSDQYQIQRRESMNREILSEKTLNQNTFDARNRRLSNTEHEDSYKLVRDTERFSSGLKNNLTDRGTYYGVCRKEEDRSHDTGTFGESTVIKAQQNQLFSARETLQSAIQKTEDQLIQIVMGSPSKKIEANRDEEDVHHQIFGATNIHTQPEVLGKIEAGKPAQVCSRAARYVSHSEKKISQNQIAQPLNITGNTPVPIDMEMFIIQQIKKQFEPFSTKLQENIVQTKAVTMKTETSLNSELEITQIQPLVINLPRFSHQGPPQPNMALQERQQKSIQKNYITPHKSSAKTAKNRNSSNKAEQVEINLVKNEPQKYIEQKSPQPHQGDLNQIINSVVIDPVKESTEFIISQNTDNSENLEHHCDNRTIPPNATINRRESTQKEFIQLPSEQQSNPQTAIQQNRYIGSQTSQVLQIPQIRREESQLQIQPQRSARITGNPVSNNIPHEGQNTKVLQEQNPRSVNDPTNGKLIHINQKTSQGEKTQFNDKKQQQKTIAVTHAFKQESLNSNQNQATTPNQAVRYVIRENSQGERVYQRILIDDKPTATTELHQSRFETSQILKKFEKNLSPLKPKQQNYQPPQVKVQTQEQEVSLGPQKQSAIGYQSTSRPPRLQGSSASVKKREPAIIIAGNDAPHKGLIRYHNSGSNQLKPNDRTLQRPTIRNHSKDSEDDASSLNFVSKKLDYMLSPQSSKGEGLTQNSLRKKQDAPIEKYSSQPIQQATQSRIVIQSDNRHSPISKIPVETRSAAKAINEVVPAPVPNVSKQTSTIPQVEIDSKKIPESTQGQGQPSYVSKFQHFMKSSRNSVQIITPVLSQDQKAKLKLHLQQILSNQHLIEDKKKKLGDIKSFDPFTFFENFSINGALGLEELKTLFDIIALEVKDQDILALIKRYDKNLDGGLDYMEFLDMTEMKLDSTTMRRYKSGYLHGQNSDETPFGYGPDAEYEIETLRNMFQSLLILQKNDDSSWESISADLGHFFEQSLSKNSVPQQGIQSSIKILTLENILEGFVDLGLNAKITDLRSLIERYDFTFDGRFLSKF